MNNWVEVKDDKPVVGEYVLILLEGETMLKGRLCNNGWSAYFADGEKLVGTREVTHWMLQPALPGEVEAKPNKDRLELAAKAMQGILSNSALEIETTPAETIAQDAVMYADALIEELSKPQP